MNRYYISSKSFRTIILAKTEAAAKMLFEIANPNLKVNICLKMAA